MLLLRAHSILPPAGLRIGAPVLLVLLALQLSSRLDARSPVSGGSPNIILLMADDLGYECLSSNGGSPYRTPELDRLAATGVRFRHCHSQPLCTPSRVQIMTGQYNYRNYVKFGLLRPGERTFAHVLRQAGYRTAIAGKWQLGGDSEGVRKFGFDRHCLWHLKGRGSRFWEPIIVEDGVEISDRVKDRYGPDVFVDFIEKFIEEGGEKPFFVYFPMALTHWPFVPTPDSPPGGSRERSGRYDGQRGGLEYFPDMVAYTDKLVGRLDRKLAELGIRDDTVLMFTGDNGNATNITSRLEGREIQGAKGTMIDAGDRVPLVVSWPGGIPTPHTSDALVDFTDFLPTLAELAGQDLGTEIPVDGVSFVPVLTEKSAGKRTWSLCHYNPRPPVKPGNEAALRKLEKRLAGQREAKRLGRYIRTRRFKLFDDGRFYDLVADPLESRSLPPGSTGKEGEAVRVRLAGVLADLPPFRPFLEEPGEPSGKDAP